MSLSGEAVSLTSLTLMASIWLMLCPSCKGWRCTRKRTRILIAG